jgi:hypothetical protein
MKRVGEIAIWLAAGLVLSAGARADDVASADNPYIPIVTRNIFALNPPDTNALSDVDPPPKITLKGIMSANGNSQALYTVAGTGKPGQPAKDQSYILSEGQGQDDVEVMHINDKAGLVTFNNHGTVQDIPLANAPTGATSGISGAGTGKPASRPSFGRPTGGRNGGAGGEPDPTIPSRHTRAGRSNRNSGNDASQNPDAPIPGGGSTPGGGLSVDSLLSPPLRTANGNVSTQPNPNPLSPDESAALIEIQREAYKNQNSPIAYLLPPTKFTPPDALGPTGNPLVRPVVPPPAPTAP